MSDGRRRICVIVPTHISARMGGAQYQVEQLVQRMSERQDLCVRYLARKIDPSFKPKNYELESFASSTDSGMGRLGHLVDCRRLYSRLALYNPDVIYERVGGAFTGVAALFAQRNGKRFVWHVAHDNDVTPGLLAHSAPRLVRRAERFLLDYGLGKADVIIAQTRAQQERIERFFGRRDSVLVPNFHPTPTEKLDKTGIRQVVWVANFKKWKRPEAFVALAEKLVAFTSARFIMLGARSEDHFWQTSLEERIAHVPNLEYLGEVSQQAVNELLATSHLFVNTSEAEGFANTFIQAWLRQVPVVSLSVDPDGVLGREGIGFGCEGDESRLHEVVRGLLTNENERSAMGVRAQAYAAEHHSELNMARLITILDADRQTRSK